MNIVCDKALLSSAIDGVSKAVTLRSSIPALEGILLKAEGFQLTLTGYDLEMGITTTIEANVRQAGEIVLSAKLLGDMVRRLPSGEVSIYTNESGNATIKGGVAEFDILAMSASDYPDLPTPGADHTLTIKAGMLRGMIEKTLYAVSQDDKKPAHTGELFAIEEDKLTVVALDGYRLAIVERPVQAEKHIRIIIPAKTLTEVNKLLGDDEDDVRISANRRFVVFNSGNYTILSRLIEGEFLNYANVIPNGCKTRVVLETRDFIDTIERASLIITERLKNPLRILFDASGKVTVRCQTNLGKVVDEFSAQVEGDPVEIGFNNRYLLDALRNARCEKVVLELSGPLSPVKILPEEGEDFIYLVLPVRFKND
ncbi:MULTISPECIES: DNA polymerase III subunit beta [Allofournierella]|uniref:Beta sliding clamp n=1 Tax=Allofournierella massiliensis TaxID=1650663 RepID=A0A4R1QSG9_9FIRM|nr:MULTISPECIES: DNA polymerase III subunit beta [Fournierella]MDM8202422.1 DNA polymerase III subunit beta [Fournierella massiliensis]TCL53784.1 DNA polymerase-3 subunit beta [Fournierella massiliensis]